MKLRILNLLKGKGTYLIYLFSYLIFILLNNIFDKTYRLLFYGYFDMRFRFWAVWCGNRNYEFDRVKKTFFTFLFLKLVFVVSVFLFSKLKVNLSIRKFISEICISFLLFDVLYLILTPISYYVNFDLNWYYGSQLDQLIMNEIPNFPWYVTPLFWLIILLLFVAGTEYKNLKLRFWIYRFGGLLLSFILFYVMREFCIALLGHVFPESIRKV